VNGQAGVAFSPGAGQGFFLGARRFFGGGRSSNREETGRVNPGNKSSPRRVSDSLSTVETSGAVCTVTVRFLGSTIQANVVPARKSSFSLRRISPGVLFSLSTSTARSGKRFGTGW